jgi:undecaprenyl-diphosphatase
MIFLTDPGLSGHIFILAAAFILLRKGRDGLLILLLAVTAIGIADYTASGIFKPLFQRVRPCFALEDVRLLVRQARTFSFASSHAANAAALSSMIWLFFRRGAAVDRAFTATMIIHGMLVAFSRIYVGVHYPGDVLGGIVIGMFSTATVYSGASWIVKNVVQIKMLRNPAE